MRSLLRDMQENGDLGYAAEAHRVAGRAGLSLKLVPLTVSFDATDARRSPRVGHSARVQ